MACHELTLLTSYIALHLIRPLLSRQLYLLVIYQLLALRISKYPGCWLTTFKVMMLENFSQHMRISIIKRKDLFITSSVTRHAFIGISLLLNIQIFTYQIFISINDWIDRAIFGMKFEEDSHVGILIRNGLEKKTKLFLNESEFISMSVTWRPTEIKCNIRLEGLPCAGGQLY